MMNGVGGSCSERELLLHGLADNELDAANALAVEEHLHVCPACAAAYQEIIQQKELFEKEDLRLRASEALRGRVLTAIHAEAGTETLPATLAPAKAPSASQTTSYPRWPKALAVLSPMALAASLALFVYTANQAPAVDQQLVASHVRSLLASHLTDVASSDQHTVKPWFLGKLDFSPPVSDLAEKGFPLIGGRLDYVGGRVVAALVYKRHSHVVNLFVWPAGKMKAAPETLDGYHVLSWTQGGFAYAAVSDLNPTEMKEFQSAFEGALPS
ncbi:MAG: anti-sigma factor [Rhodomicrobium sp.]